MIDVKRLRDEPDYRLGIERKRVRPGLIDEVLAADDARRVLLGEVEELRAEFDAIVLAGGATVARDLPIPGRELEGVMQAMEFLPLANKVQEGDLDDHPHSARGKRVVIIGGGDTGADCLGTSHRHGAASVHQFEIMPRPPDSRAESTPWPQWPVILRTSTSHEEGCRREWCILTKEFLGDDTGRLRALKTVRIEWYTDAASGQFKFRELPGTEEEWPCQLALLISTALLMGCSLGPGATARPKYAGRVARLPG